MGYLQHWSELYNELMHSCFFRLNENNVKKKLESIVCRYLRVLKSAEVWVQVELDPL